MQIGMIGLGRMGANMVRRLLKAGHECVVFDVNKANVDALVAEGAVGSTSMADLVSKLAAPRAVWLMLPAAITHKIALEIAGSMQKGDALIDGGNSNYRDAMDLANELAPKGIDMIDAGTSGGVWGLDRGYCMMIGGPKDVLEHLDPIFGTLAPGIGDVERTPGRSGNPSRVDRGYIHSCQVGAAHFVKMIHNGI